MDKALERSQKGKILRQLARALRDLGFTRTKPTFFTRPRSLVVEFVHLHKYSFDSDFRVHLGVRVTNDPFDAIALNGPDSHPYVCKGSPAGRRFNFCFDDTTESVERCVAELAVFVSTIGENWFRAWREDSALLDRADSPLHAEDKASLQRALTFGPDEEKVEQTKRLLGLA
jgi:hypothetical protein